MSNPQAVLVSGASTGIGAATAELLAREGYVAFAGVRTESDANRVAALHENIRPIHLDVTDGKSIADAVREVVAGGVPLRGVVSNAGIALGGPLELLPIEELRRLFDVNVFGALALVQTALPHLAEHAGRVVFVGSISGRLAVPFVAPYSASKFALRALADSLRAELAPVGIMVSLIEPGSVKTPIWQKGRDSRGRLAALIGPGARPHYGPAVEALMRQTQREEETGMPVERVARAILHALRNPRPRANYLLGAPARIGSVVALLPQKLRDSMLRASMRF